jgi:hypothetical protein
MMAMVALVESAWRPTQAPFVRSKQVFCWRGVSKAAAVESRTVGIVNRSMMDVQG